MATYKDAGVDIDAQDKALEQVKKMVRKTYTSGVLSDQGAFGGLFKVPKGFKEPVLVASADGVGTKLKLAMQMGRHDTIGIDLVAMCVNDIIVAGAEPLFFLDYFATGKLEVDVAEAEVQGQSLDEFLDVVALLSDADDEGSPDALSVMTLHAAKGLEFDVVVIVGMEEPIFPNRRAVEEQGRGLEEERRTLEEFLDEALHELGQKDTQIQTPEQRVKKARSSPRSRESARERETLAKRLRTLYKNLEFDDRAVAVETDCTDLAHACDWCSDL